MAHGGPDRPGHRARPGLLAGHEVGRGRTYRLSRILAAEELAEPAQRPDRVDLDRAWQERSTQFRTGGDQVTVLVRVNPPRREELVGTALAVLADEADVDGWLRLELTFQAARHAERALWQLGWLLCGARCGPWEL